LAISRFSGLLLLALSRSRGIGVGLLVLWRMRIRALDLNEALGADGLVTASSFVEIRGIVQKADWAFGRILIEINLNRLAVDKGILGKLQFPRGQICL
jgi:hypothetical protein